MSTKIVGLASAIAACLATAPATPHAHAAAPIDGTWGVRIVQPDTGCEWVGQIRLDEQAGRIAGRGRAAPTSAARQPARCPMLEGEVQGERRGDVVRFGFATGRLGKADFAGRLDPDGKVMRGSWSARSASGHWAAGR